jgi:hypothetical protein
MTKIIFLNGPPGSGKDTVAKLIRDMDRLRIYNERMSWPAKEGLTRMFGLRPQYVQRLEIASDTSQPLFNGMTWRQMQILLIENYLKEFFGEAILGELCAQRIMERDAQGTMYNCYTVDVGQVQECIPLIERFGKTNCKLIRLIRPKHTFTDTREYIGLWQPYEIKAEELNNRFDLDILPTQVQQLVGDWI